MPDETNQQQQPTQVQQPEQTAQPQVVVQTTPATAGTSGMAITGLVLGLLSILTSFIPIVNNASFFLAILGIVFAGVGIAATKPGKKNGRGLAIAGLVLGILSIVIVLATQSFYGAVLDEATKSLDLIPNVFAAIGIC